MTQQMRPRKIAMGGGDGYLMTTKSSYLNHISWTWSPSHLLPRLFSFCLLKSLPCPPQRCNSKQYFFHSQAVLIKLCSCLSVFVPSSLTYDLCACYHFNLKNVSLCLDSIPGCPSNTLLKCDGFYR